MKEILLAGGPSSPRISFDPGSRRLEMEGRSLMENPKAFYQEVRRELDALVANQPKGDFQAMFFFEYLNTTSTKEVFRILQLSLIHI